jgi:hypothetical protein
LVTGAVHGLAAEATGARNVDPGTAITNPAITAMVAPRAVRRVFRFRGNLGSRIRNDRITLLQSPIFGYAYCVDCEIDDQRLLVTRFPRIETIFCRDSITHYFIDCCSRCRKPLNRNSRIVPNQPSFR